MPSSADPDCFRCGLAGTDSASESSAITLETSRDLLLRCGDSGMVKSTEWTDEKHGIYLDYLEASFVQELYRSMPTRDLGSKMNSQIPYSSGQTMVIGDERRKKINYEMDEPLLESTADSRVEVERHWLPHFARSSKSRTMAYPDAQEHVTFKANGSHLRGKQKCLYGSARTSEHNSVGHQMCLDSVGNCTEVSDQNFVEFLGENSRCKFMSKRSKITLSDCSSKDQEHCLVTLEPNLEGREFTSMHVKRKGMFHGRGFSL